MSTVHCEGLQTVTSSKLRSVLNDVKCTLGTSPFEQWPAQSQSEFVAYEPTPMFPSPTDMWPEHGPCVLTPVPRQPMCAEKPSAETELSDVNAT